MTTKTAITVLRPREEAERPWSTPPYRRDGIPQQAHVDFRRAPGDRGTEIHLDLGAAARGPLGQALGKLTGLDPLAETRDELRRFKQLVEAGEIARCDGAPRGTAVERQPKQRPAQPVEPSRLREVGA